MDLDRQKMSAQVVSEFATRLILNYGEQVGKRDTTNIINSLIQYSYELGHNNFEIFTTHALNDFGRHLTGEPGRLLKISVIGDLGDSCFWDARYIAASVRGNIGETYNIERSLLDFHGSVSADTRGIAGCTIRHKSQEVLDMLKKACKYATDDVGLKNMYLLMPGTDAAYRRWYL